MAGRIKLLGGALFSHDTAAAPLPVDRRGCLLALLAAEGGWVDRERLALLFWPESGEAAAKAALRQLLVRVKRLTLSPALEVTHDAMRWRVDSDLGDFRRALAEGDAVAAVAAYAGPFLAGFAAHDVGGVDAWMETERDQLHAAFHGACMRAADGAVAEGRYVDAVDMLTRLEALDPLAEDVVVALVRARYLGGRRDAALQAFERFAARLEAELGLEPLEATRALVDAVRRGDPVSAPAPATPTGPPRRLAPSRLVARDAERRALLVAATPVVVAAGEPGIGKTALLREFVPDGLWCGAVEGLERLPYHPLAALVRARPDLAEGLGPYREDLARLVPEAAPGVMPAPLDPTAARGRLAEALARFVAASGGPLVVDDLQWADPATLETLGYLARGGARVVGAYRVGEAGPALQEALAAWRAAGALTEVRISPLSAEAVQALIADLMGRAEGPPTFARALHRRSGGNPLFLLETLAALFEARVLRADDAGWHTDLDAVTRDYSELDVPPRVSAVIVRRLRYLSDPTTRVLEALAIAQADLDARSLARVTGLSKVAVADALDEAVSVGFLEAQDRSAAVPSFRHDLLRQTLDARLPPARRRLLHGLVAEALEAADAGRRSDDARRADPGRVAEHWFAAGEPARARTAWLEQAAALRGRGLQTDAVAALAAARGRLSDGEDADWLRAVQALAALELGDADDAEALLTAPPADAAALRLRFALARVTLHFHRGSVAEARAELAALRPWVDLVDDDDLRFEYLIQSGRAAKEEMHFDEAIAAVEPAVALLRARPPSLRLVQFVSSLAALYDDTGRAEQALPLHREALGLAKALGSRYYQVEVSINLLFCTADLGRYDEATDWAEEALTLGDYDNVPVLRTNLAANYFQAGRYADALRHYAQLADHDAQPHLQVIALARSAECHALLGRTESVAAPLDRALERLPHTDFPVAVGAAAIALLRFGDAGQVARLRSLVPDLAPARFPPHQRPRLEAALAARADADA
jgi:DNA-binding SARP family transcriptional activator/tetratricopeptide (TPR) repeat protein